MDIHGLALSYHQRPCFKNKMLNDERTTILNGGLFHIEFGTQTIFFYKKRIFVAYVFTPNMKNLQDIIKYLGNSIRSYNSKGQLLSHPINLKLNILESRIEYHKKLQLLIAKLVMICFIRIKPQVTFDNNLGTDRVAGLKALDPNHCRQPNL